jgi:hypothetical protein
MTAAVRQLLDSFDALPAPEQHEAIVEMLRRASASTTGDITEAGLIEIADELFQALDAEEARHVAS